MLATPRGDTENTADRVISIERRPRLAAPFRFTVRKRGRFNFSRLGHGGFVKLNLI